MRRGARIPLGWRWVAVLGLFVLLASPALGEVGHARVLLRGKKGDPVVARVESELRLLDIQVERIELAEDRIQNLEQLDAVLDVDGQGVTIRRAEPDSDGELFVSRRPEDHANVVALAVVELLRARILHPAQEPIVEPSTVAKPLEKEPATRLPGTPPEQHRLYLGLLAGLRRHALSSAHQEPRLGVDLTWLEVVRGPEAPRLRAGLGIEAISGTGVPVADELYSGYWTDTDLRVAFRFRMEVPAGVDLRAGLGAGLVHTRLDGSVVQTGTRTHSVRVNGAALGWAGIGLRAAEEVRLGLRVGATRMARTQTYLVGGAPVLDMNPLVLDGALEIEIGLF